LAFFAISSVTNQGTQELVAAIAVRLDELKASSEDATIQLAV
jgi:hypothetical protein